VNRFAGRFARDNPKFIASCLTMKRARTNANQGDEGHEDDLISLDALLAEAQAAKESLFRQTAGPGEPGEKASKTEVPANEPRCAAAIEKQIEHFWAEFRRTQTDEHGVFPLQGTVRCTFGHCQGKRLRGAVVLGVGRGQSAEAGPWAGELGEALRLSEAAAFQHCHACTRFCTHPPGVFRGAKRVAGTGQALCEKIFLCERHVKVHVCGPFCQETYKDALGFSKCVLSGLTVAQAEGYSFFDGTRYLWDDGSSAAAAPAAGRNARSVTRAVPETSFVPGEPVGKKGPPGGGLKNAAPPDDTPCSGMFSGSRAGNTFGDGIAGTLDELYEVSWGAVFLLLFSERRAALEGLRLEKLQKEARRKISGTMLEDLKTGKWVFLDKMMSSHRSIMSSKRVYPGSMVLPQNAKARLNAYYAMVLVEFTVNLFSLCDDLKETEEIAGLIARGNRAACGLARIAAYDSRAFAVNCFTLLVSDFSGPDGAEDVIFGGAHEDPALGLMPESSTVEKLGVPEKICTDIKKDVKYALTMGKKGSNEAMRALRATTIPLEEIYYGKQPDGQHFSVVAEFLNVRRERQSAEEREAREDVEKTRNLLQEVDL